jgi:hypothetical protein
LNPNPLAEVPAFVGGQLGSFSGHCVRIILCRRRADTQDGTRTIADFLYDLVARHETAWLIFLLATVFASAIVSSQRKPLWYDELFTEIVASQPTWHKFAQAMPVDAHPPINALLTRVSIHFFSITELSLRLPPMVGFVAALAGIYVFIRRECGAVFGLFGVVLTIAEPAWVYSFEARPYGVLLGFRC